MPKAKTSKQRRTKRRAVLRANALPSECRFVDASGTVDLQAAISVEGDNVRPFQMLAYTGGKLRVAVFDHPAVVDLQGLTAGQKTPILLDHKPNQRVGHSDMIVNDGRTLSVDGKLSAATSHRDEVLNSSRGGFPWQSSIGVRMQSIRKVRPGETIQANGRTFTGPLYLVAKSTLHEVSFVTIGGDEGGATATITAAHTPLNPPTGKDASMTFEQWLQAKGFDPATMTAESRTYLQAQYDADQETTEVTETESTTTQTTQLTATAGQNGTTNTTLQATGLSENDMLRAMRAENARVHGIETLCAQFGDPTFRVNNQEVNLQAHAISEGWDLARTELECRRESRGAGPAVHSHSHEGSCTLQAMEGALLLRAGIALDHEQFATPEATAMELPRWLRASINDDTRQRAMEAAHRFSDLSMIDIAREAIRLDGRSLPSGRNNIIEAAFSGASLTKLFTTNINAAVLKGFGEIEDPTAGWTSRNTNVPNFQPRELIRLKNQGGMKKLARGKTAEHRSFEDTGEQYKIARFAEQLQVDEQDMIDDRFDLISTVPQQMANDAARLIPDLVFAILLRNPTMGDSIALFHASHGNLLTGNALTEAGLKALITQLKLMQENSITLNLMPTHLIIPESLSWTAEGLIASNETRAASASGGVTRNTLNGKVKNIVADARLDNGLTDPDTETAVAGSTTDYYLLDSRYPAIEVGTLAGSGGVPVVRRKMLDKGQWGMNWDIKHDVGAKALRTHSIHKAEA